MPEARRVASFRQEKAEQPPSMEERREVLFERIEKELRKGDKEERINIVARVFEHSTEDGIRLADRLLFTPEELQDAVLSPGYLLKHQQVVDRLIGERSKSSVNTPTERAFVSVLGALDRMRTKNFRSGIAHLTAKGLETAQFQQKFAEKHQAPNYQDVDRFYADLVRSRAPIESSQRKAEGVASTRSRGERMAENYLAEIAEVLERRFYTGPIKERFHGFAQDPILHQPTITEDELRAFAEKYKLDPEQTVKQLNQARVVAYRQIDAMKKGAVLGELLKELKDEGISVRFDRESDKYVLDQSLLQRSERFQWTEEEIWNMRVHGTPPREVKYLGWDDDIVDILNLVRNPELKDVKTFLDALALFPEVQKQRERERMEHSPLMARIFTDTSKMDLDTARAFLRTNAAVPDRSPDLLAELLVKRMMPYRTAPNTTSMWDRFTGLFRGKGGESLRGNPEAAFLDNPSWEMMGGGAEALSDTRMVLESREPIDSLLATGIYG
ncbi:MAG: hypothetical protein AAB386_00145 [Patescibacteria group bacterium]